MLKRCKSIRVALIALVVSTSAPALRAAAPNPDKIIVVPQISQSLGMVNRRSVGFYEVTNLGSGDTISQTPLFSVWLGYEISAQSNFEEISSVTVNPVNGTVYVSAFDSGPVGVQDLVGDTQGDWDLYKINYQSILTDFKANNRPMGTMYAPTTGADGASKVQHPDYGANTVFTTNTVQKIGQLARTQDGGFYDPSTNFVNPGRIVLVDNVEGTTDAVANDHQIRVWNRVSTSPGAATTFGTNEGGFNGGNTTQSWESRNYGVLDMDDGTGVSEPTDSKLVTRDGVTGLWVGEADGGGDDVSFFKLNFAAHTATKQELKVGSSPYPQGFALDNDPVANPTTNDGVLDWVGVTPTGNLIIGESGFFETTNPGGQNGNGGVPGASEPKVITRDILNYNGPDTDANLQNEVVPGAWTVSKNLAIPTADDDAAVTDGRFGIYDAGTGRVIYIDADSGSPPNVVADVYIFDPATGAFTYQEQNAINAFITPQTLALFVRGDTNGDGIVNAIDIDRLFAGGVDPTFGGTVTNATGQEWYDLTGDSLLNTATATVPSGALENSDADELVQKILNTQYGDANLDGNVSIADFATLQNNFSKNSGWAGGDFNGDSKVTIGDFALLQNNYGFTNMPSAAAFPTATIPEPSSLMLAGIGALLVGWGAARSRRRRG